MIYSHIIPFISLRCWSINFQIYISLGTEDPGSWDRFLWLNPDRLSGLQMMGIHYCVAMADWLFLSQSAMANGERQPLGTRFARMPKRFFYSLQSDEAEYSIYSWKLINHHEYTIKMFLGISQDCAWENVCEKSDYTIKWIKINIKWKLLLNYKLFILFFCLLLVSSMWLFAAFNGIL